MTAPAPSEPSPRRPRRAFRIAALALGVAGALLALELTLWLAAPVPDPYGAIKPQVGGDLLIYPDPWKMPPGTVRAIPNLPGTSGGSFRLNRRGLRGDVIEELKPDELRIMTLGGSTTFCAAQADGKDWPSLVKAKLAAGGRTVRLLNAAYSGQTLRRHLIAATQLTPVVRPRYLVVLAGINDAVFNLSQDRPQDRLGPAAAPIRGRPWSSLKLFLSESQLFRRVLRSRGLARQAALTDSAKATAALPVTSKTPQIQVDVYRDCLELLSQIAETFGARLVLVTQPAIYLSTLPDAEVDPRCWMNRIGNERWSRAVIRRSLEAFNAVTREVAAAKGALLVDAAAALDNDLTEMFDDCHFTDQGCAELAELIAAALAADQR